MAAEGAVPIERLDAAGAREDLPALVEILRDAVDGGASVSFLPPLGAAEAERYWRGIVAAVDAATRILLVARVSGRIDGTVQLDLDQPQNGGHRAEVAKLLVHRRARRRGLGRAMLSAIEEEALRAGRTLLVLDTRRGDAGEGLYRSQGYVEAGVIPGYARSAEGSRTDTVFFYRVFEPDTSMRMGCGEGGS